MNAVLRGHPHVKTPIDVACRDILGKIAGLPAYVVLSGSQQESVKPYRAISPEAPEVMARKISGDQAEGYTSSS